MGAIKNGIKSGLLSGLIYFLINSIINFAMIIFFIGEIVIAEGVPETTKDLSIFLTLLINHQIETIFITGLLFGVLFSILLLKYYDTIPGATLKGKTNFFVIIYWIVFFIIIPVYELGFSIIIALPYLITYIVVNFLTSLFFGYLIAGYNSKYIIRDKNNHPL